MSLDFDRGILGRSLLQVAGDYQGTEAWPHHNLGEKEETSALMISCFQPFFDGTYKHT